MLPDYFTFIRFQDKRILPFFYLILGIVLGFFWKNNAFRITSADAWPVAVILAITLYNLIYELRAYWVYSCIIERIDMTNFVVKNHSPLLIFLTRPPVVSLLSVALFWLLVQASVRLPSVTGSAMVIFLAAPLLAFMVFRALRSIYVNQVMTQVPDGIKYKSLSWYVSSFVGLTVIVNVLSIGPLKANPDFTLTDGYFSAKLMVAMLILCAIVLAINLVFARISKRYIFFGRMYLKEIDFSPQASLLPGLQRKGFIVRMLLLFGVQCVWIILVGMVLTLVNAPKIFEAWFLLCFVPCISYYFLHLYWHWHNEFLTGCDMYFRHEAIKKRNQ